MRGMISIVDAKVLCTVVEDCGRDPCQLQVSVADAAILRPGW